MNSRQRKRDRTEKELLNLGRDAKQVRANASSMEEQVRSSAKTIGELQTKVSQLEIDRDAWKERAVTAQDEGDAARALVAEVTAQRDSTDALLGNARRLLEATKARVAELEEGLRELPKLRRRLQDRAVEVADLERAKRGLEALLKRHEREASAESAMVAGAKAGL